MTIAISAAAMTAMTRPDKILVGREKMRWLVSLSATGVPEPSTSAISPTWMAAYTRRRALKMARPTIWIVLR